MPRTIRIAAIGVAQDYRESLVPLVITSLGNTIQWESPKRADLIIIGPFLKPKRPQRWLPKPVRPLLLQISEHLGNGNRPPILFQTGENLRHDHIPCDFSISFDLSVSHPHHFRLPYWMEMIDWSHEGIVGNKNPRFGKLLELERMAAPLGRKFLRKPRRAAIFASHLREPRATLIQALQRHIEVIGFGPGFDRSIKGHLESNFTKLDTLENFAFNLCPENSMSPGYYTEKIPEAFVADCLPIAWTDSNVQIDFNPQAMVNLAPMMATDFQDLGDTYLSPSFLQDFSEQPLLQNRPTLDSLKSFLRKVLDSTI